MGADVACGTCDQEGLHLCPFWFMEPQPHSNSTLPPTSGRPLLVRGGAIILPSLFKERWHAKRDGVVAHYARLRRQQNCRCRSLQMVSTSSGSRRHQSS